MNIRTGFLLVSFCISIVFAAGCTGADPKYSSPVETPTPEIVYITVFVTQNPEITAGTQSATPDSRALILQEDLKKDEEFIDYIECNKIYEDMVTLERMSSGSYSISSGYNSAAKKESLRLTTLLTNASMPGSETVKGYRSAMMDALSEMDGSTAGFTRYRDAFETVILARNTALSEMHSAGSSIVDTIYLSGYGNSVRSFNMTEAGTKIFSMHHTGDRNFAVTLKDDSTGKYISLLVNDIGLYNGKKSEMLAVGNYSLDITADGEWTIGITPG
jgi:hypothetical protein